MMIKRFLLLILLFPLLANAGMVMPEVIRPPVGQVAKLTVHAIGDQIYQCVLAVSYTHLTLPTKRIV